MSPPLSKATAAQWNIARVALVTGNMYLPLCCKPKMLTLLKAQPGLLEHTIRSILRTDASDSNLVVFIADGDVMAQAQIATGKTRKSALQKVAHVSLEITEMVQKVIAKIKRESPKLAQRLAGVVHWKDVAADRLCAVAINSLRRCLRSASTDDERMIPTAMKQLVKNLYTQRAQKCGLSNIFEEGSLELVSDPKNAHKNQKRYTALEEACILELGSIMTGFEHGGRRFTEMRYLNTDPRGMSYISAALQEIRFALALMPAKNNDILNLKLSCTETHGLVLLNLRTEAKQEAPRKKTEILRGHGATEEKYSHEMKDHSWESPKRVLRL